MSFRYRLKVDTPWADKDMVYLVSKSGFCSVGASGCLFNPREYPHLFEPLEDKSDVERVVEWLEDFSVSIRYPLESRSIENLAKIFISVGLNVDKLMEISPHLKSELCP